MGSVDFKLSKKATDIAGKFTDTGKFKSDLDVARFAMGYALRNYYDEFDLDAYTLGDTTNGHSYNFGSVDPDGSIRGLIKALYPDADLPNLCVLKLMDYGLIKLGELVDEKGMPDIYTLF